MARNSKANISNLFFSFFFFFKTFFKFFAANSPMYSGFGVRERNLSSIMVTNGYLHYFTNCSIMDGCVDKYFELYFIYFILWVILHFCLDNFAFNKCI